MKKLVLRLCQSILRRLATSASTGTPWTSKVSVPPTPTPKYFAAASSTETRGRAAASLAVHQRPRVITFAGGGSAAQVNMYSRVRYQILSGASRFRRSISSRVTDAPSIAASRSRTTGVSAAAVPPTAATRRARRAEGTRRRSRGAGGAGGGRETGGRGGSWGGGEKRGGGGTGGGGGGRKERREERRQQPEGEPARKKREGRCPSPCRCR